MSSGRSQASQSFIRSYVTLRRAVGALGVALPFIVSVAAYLLKREGIQPSVSDYYHTSARNAFVGLLWAIGVFLAFYTGYERIDTVASVLAGLFAIGVSVFPTKLVGAQAAVSKWVGYLHTGSAALFFVTLACMSLFLFTRTNPEKRKITAADYRSLLRRVQWQYDPERELTRRKLQRNVIYIVCGSVMLLALALIPALKPFWDNEGSCLHESNFMFWMEAVAIVAFGVSWLVKGELILKDIRKPEKTASPAAKPEVDAPQ